MITKLKFIKKNLIWVLIFLFGFLYSFWSIYRQISFQTDAIDLGIFDQVIWHYSRFEIPLSSVKFSTYPGPNILGDHFHPILALLAPLFWVWDDVRMILIAQAVGVVVGAYPIYKLAVAKLKSEFLSLGIAFAYLGFIGVQTLIDYDFHEIAFALPVLAYGVWFLYQKKYFWYFAMVILGFFIKEDVPLIMATLGLYALVRYHQLKVGLITIVISLIGYWLITAKIIPYFKGEAFGYENLPPEIGKTGLDLIKVTITNPLLVITAAFYDAQWVKLRTILNLLASWAFLPLFAPTALVLTASNISSRFLTTLSQRWIIRFQYSAILSPIFAVATIDGIENIFKITSKFKFLDKFQNKLPYCLGILLTISTIYITLRNNGPFERILNPASYQFDDRFQLNNKLIREIPKNASVMAQSAFVPHLSHREKIFRYDESIFQRMKEKPEYIIMSLDEHTDPPFLPRDLLIRIEKLRARSDYETLFWDGKRLLLKLK